MPSVTPAVVEGIWIALADPIEGRKVKVRVRSSWGRGEVIVEGDRFLGKKAQEARQPDTADVSDAAREVTTR